MMPTKPETGAPSRNVKAGAFGVGDTEAMTEQEAEALVEMLVARITQIWQPEAPEWDWDKGGGFPFIYRALLSPGVNMGAFSLSVGHSTLSPDLGFLLEFTQEEKSIGRMVIGADEKGNRQFLCKSLGSDVESLQKFEQLVARYTPLLRCNSWLCGCDIEASAHEKAEWIQGFSREEVEAWNLKM